MPVVFHSIWTYLYAPLIFDFCDVIIFMAFWEIYMCCCWPPGAPGVATSFAEIVGMKSPEVTTWD